MRRLVVVAWLAGVAAGCGDSNKTEIPKNVPPPPSGPSQMKAEAGGQQQKAKGDVSSGAAP